MNVKRRPAPPAAIAAAGPVTPRPVEANLAPSISELPIPEAVIRELESSLHTRQAGPATSKFGERIRDQLEYHYPRLVLTRCLPVSRWSLEQSQLAIARLSQAVGPLLPQNLSGISLYDVKDTGVASRPGIRRSITNEEQPFHTDGPWLATPPRILALHCLRPARTGGENRYLNLRAILARLRLTDREAVARLAKPLPWHRQGEHHALEAPISEHPLWWEEEYYGTCFRLNIDYVTSAAQTPGGSLDQAAQNALYSLEGLLRTAKDLTSSFRLSTGQSIWLNNWVYAHARTAFEDRKQGRHLIRTWHR